MSFFLHANYFPEDILVIHKFLVATGFMVPIIYFYFISDFTENSSSILKVSSFLTIILIIAIDFLGFVIQSSSVKNNLIDYQVSSLFYISFFLVFCFIIVSVYYLVKKLINSSDNTARKQLICLCCGLAIVIISSLNLFWSVSQKYPIEHAGNIINAAILAYVILKYNLFRIRVPILMNRA